MTTKQDDLDILKCGICCDLLNIPKSLPCLHIFCQSCLCEFMSSAVKEPEKTKSKREKLMCPVCASVVANPKQVSVTNYVSQLPTNKFIKTLIERSKSKEPLCEQCQEDDKEEKATAWCIDCDGGLCDQCLQLHKKIKALKFHAVTDIEDIGKRMSRISYSQNCKEHTDKTLDSYCNDHQVPCCPSCVTTYHWKCGHMTTLKEAAKDVEKSPGITDLLKDMSDIHEIIEEYVGDQETTLKHLEADKQDIMNKIQTFRRDVNAHLDKLERDLLNRFTTMHDEQFNSIKMRIDKCMNSEKIVSNCEKLLRSLIKCGSEINLFLEKETICRKVKEEEDKMVKRRSDPYKLRYHMSLTPELVKITSSIQSLGTVQSVKLYTAQENVGKLCDLPRHFVPSLRDCKQIATFHSDKCDTERFHGVGLLTDGRVLLTSHQHNSLYLFSSQGDVQKQVTIPGSPLDVTVISDDKAAVSYWGIPNGICIVDISTMEIDKQNINKNVRGVYGLTSVGGNVIGVCRDMIVAMDKKGSELNDIKTPSLDDAFRYVTAVSDTRLCYTSHHTVVCIDFDGTEIFTYKHQDLSWPCGVTSDNEGFIYVAGNRSDNVHQLSPDGRLIKILLSESDGINTPRAINFDRKNNKMLLTHSGSKVTSYQMTK